MDGCCETFRADRSKFTKDFAEYLMSKSKDHWEVKNCTFFNDKEKDRMWACCSFEC